MARWYPDASGSDLQILSLGGASRQQVSRNVGEVCYAPRHAPLQLEVERPAYTWGTASTAPKPTTRFKGKFNFGPLPPGWRELRDDDGDTYFGNQKLKIASYDDPRLILEPRPSTVLEHTPKKAPPKEKKKPEPWGIATMRTANYLKIDKRKHQKTVCPPEIQAQMKTFHRHIDILPNPRTRVQLPLINGDVRTGYTNSNYIRGADGNPKSYIATMGPKDEFLDVFWRMVWEDRVETVIMVTGIVEGGRKKCAPYFPQVDQGKEAVMQIGDFKVTNQGITNFGPFQKSVMELQLGKEKRQVSHWWFTAWPDHGVPTLPNSDAFDVDSILNLIQEVQKDRTPNTGRVPQIVHCSAGVGRTGVTIALQHAMHLLQTTGTVEPLTIIDTIRNDRCLLVQHDKQYEYLHAAIQRWCQRIGQEFYVGKKPKEKKEPKKPDTTQKDKAVRQEEKQISSSVFDDVWV